MRDPERIDRIIEELRVEWHKVPDHRLGQLVSNLSWFGAGRTDVFYLEDEALEELLTNQKWKTQWKSGEWPA